MDLHRSGGVWNLESSADDSGIVPLDNALFYVSTHLPGTQPSDPVFNFMGAGAGGQVFIMPEGLSDELLSAGFAAYGIAPSTVDTYNVTAESKGRITVDDKWLKVQLVSVAHTKPDGTAGDGTFSVYKGSTVSELLPLMSNFDDGVANPDSNGLDMTDGVSADDALWIQAGGHIHYNWGFTQPGRYEVQLRLSGYFGDNGNSTTPNTTGYSESSPFTVYFSVGNVGNLEFDASTYSVNEAAGAASITVRRVNGRDGRIAVDYATSNGSATFGADYTSTSGTLVFDDLETSKVITIPILEDSDVETDESINLTLSNPAPPGFNYYLDEFVGDPDGLLGSQQTAIVTIVDNDGTVVPPVVTGIAPFVGPTTGFQITITGTGFLGADIVSFGGNDVSIPANASDTEIVVTAPAGMGTVTVTVTNSGVTSTPTAFNPGIDQITYTDAPPTKLLSTTIDDGLQGSLVRSIALTFDADIDALAAGAILVTTEDGTPIPGLIVDVIGIGTNTITATFSDSNDDTTGPVTYGSLIDGRYKVTVNGSLLESNGQHVDADGNGSVGGTDETLFTRLFGDVDNDTFMDALDIYPHLINAIDTQVNNPGYNVAFDYDNDGDVDAVDIYPNIITRIDTGI